MKWFHFVLLHLFAEILFTRGDNSGGDLYRHLFNNYRKEVRPRNQANESITVNLDFSLMRFEYLDVRKRVLTVFGWLTLEWRDDFLTWTPSNYSSIEKIVIPASKIWLPDIALDSSISDVYNSAHINLFRATVYFDGTVIWEPGGSFSTACNIQIRYFPFDHQTCSMTFTVWQYTKDMMSVTNSSHLVNIGTYSRNGEWVVKSTSMEPAEWHDESSPGDVYSEVIMKFCVRRKFLYYFINIILPCLLMSVLVLVVFHLPPDSGEKVSLGVTVLLAFSVFQLLIAENVPASFDEIPILEFYLIFFMGESTFSVTIAVLVLNLHHRMEYKHPPNWLRRVVLNWMARMVFMKTTNLTNVYPESKQSEKSHVADDEHNEEIIGQEKVLSNLSLSRVQRDKHPSQPSIHVTTNIDNFKDTPSLSVPDQPESLFVPSIHVCDSHESEVTSFTNNMAQSTTGPSSLSPYMAKSAIKLMKSIANMEQSQSQHSRNEFMTLIRDTYRELCNQRESEALEAILENEWKRIAKVVDRFFFLVTTLLILVSTIAIFITLTSQE